MVKERPCESHGATRTNDEVVKVVLNIHTVERNWSLPPSSTRVPQAQLGYLTTRIRVTKDSWNSWTTLKQPLPHSFHFCPYCVLLFLVQVAKVIIFITTPTKHREIMTHVPHMGSKCLKVNFLHILVPVGRLIWCFSVFYLVRNRKGFKSIQHL